MMASYNFNQTEESISNDEAIARAIAESEQTSTHHSSSSNVANCPGRHGLEQFSVSNSQRVTCNGCQMHLQGGEKVWSCVQCNFDSCERCYRRGSQAFPVLAPPGNRRTVQATPTPNYASPPVQRNNNPFASNAIPTSHMCLIPCEIGSITVEMLVDTGAQSSVLSMPIVRQLGLTNRLDRRYQGVAAGVGRARIVGNIRNVVCTFGIGHVEFLMDFIVLDVNDPLVIMGLDQMRKYNCLIDIGREKLIFGGAGGVEVAMLPPSRTHFDVRSLEGCTVM